MKTSKYTYIILDDLSRRIGVVKSNNRLQDRGWVELKDGNYITGLGRIVPKSSFKNIEEDLIESLPQYSTDFCRI